MLVNRYNWGVQKLANCPTCGKLVHPDAFACPFCGQRFQTRTATVAGSATDFFTNLLALLAGIGVCYAIFVIFVDK